MMMFLMRKHGSLSQAIFQSDAKLTEVLNLIDVESYDNARHLWIVHVMDLTGTSHISLGNKKWDLWTDSFVFTAVSLLFQMTVKEVYADCSVNGHA